MSKTKRIIQGTKEYLEIFFMFVLLSPAFVLVCIGTWLQQLGLLYTFTVLLEWRGSGGFWKRYLAYIKEDYLVRLQRL